MIHIRPAMANDVPAVLPMVAAICRMHSELDSERYGMLPDVVSRYESWLPARAADPRSVFLVAESSDDGGDSARSKLAGFLVGTVEHNIPIYLLKEFGYIHDVWVEPAFRKTGVARKLVNVAVERFDSIGVEQVRLETAALNDTARRLFESCGFRVGTIDMLKSV